MSRARNLCCKSHGYPKLKEKVGDLSCREPRPCIRFKCSLVNTILDVLHQRPGWVEVKDEGDWDFYWCDANWVRESSDHTYVDEHVRISHFRNHYELTRKNYMVKNLKRFRRRVEREEGKLEARKYDFFPKTFDLPSEYHLFVEEFRKNPGTTWIMKPVARSQGRGIFLFRKLKDIMDWRKNNSRSDDRKEEAPVENYVAQRYIEDPYLIGGECAGPTVRGPSAIDRPTDRPVPIEDVRAEGRAKRLGNRNESEAVEKRRGPAGRAPAPEGPGFSSLVCRGNSGRPLHFPGPRSPLLSNGDEDCEPHVGQGPGPTRSAGIYRGA
uniref:Tubulin--tyrosine ligase-like protein 9 n=1 Tax=Ornithorhynchus anatinus TaxID=9258 RepID=F6SLV9_ORNAN